MLEQFNTANIIALHNQPTADYVTISQKQAQQYLGKEFDAVIFDALIDFNPDSLGAIIGTIKQGGVLIIWLDKSQHSLWLQRFKRVLKEFDKHNANFTIVQQGQLLPQLSLPEKHQQSDVLYPLSFRLHNLYVIPEICYRGSITVTLDSRLKAAGVTKKCKPASSSVLGIYLTEDQQKAVEAIKRVVHGHRRRPLVLSANRGRGKSASLGIAAAQLLAEGKQTILITAPSLATADTVFEHARRLLTNAQSSAGLISLNKAEIRFIAPDALIQSDLKADLVLVDEAAAIPASMLEKLLQKYSRLVFATTLHGYEGTGRGFALRFQKVLDQQTPDWHSYRMQTPIRWSEDDLLEQFSFQSLLLDAIPVDDNLIEAAQIKHCQIELLDRKLLINDEKSLRELFGLMVLAHYRTRPSDLQMMLDRDDITVYIVRYQGHIVASAWLVNEGELEGELSQSVYAGRRRLKGHLLPQSLLAHAGVTEAGSLKYQRIVRIAVHPAIQQRKLGQTLLRYCIKQSKKNGADIVGTSFAMDDDLMTFWSKSAFEFARLGIHKDDVTGNHAVMMLQAVSEKGDDIVKAAKHRFQQQWLHLLHKQFNGLTADHVIKISQLIDLHTLAINPEQQQEIDAFAYGQRGYEFSQVALWHWIGQRVGRPEFLRLNQQQQSLCVQVVLQQRSWDEIVKDLAFSGKTKAVNTLRETMAILLKSSN